MFSRNEFEDIEEPVQVRVEPVKSSKSKVRSFANEFTDLSNEFEDIEEGAPFAPTPKKQSLLGALEQGFTQHSVSGELAKQAFGRSKEEVIENPSFWESLALSGGEIAGDFPYFLAGGALGAPLGAAIGSYTGPIGTATGGLVGAGFGAFALPAFLKQALKEYSAHQAEGNDITFGEFLGRADRVASKTLNDGMFGIVLGSINKAMPMLQNIPGIGKLFTTKPAQKAASIVSETGAIATIPALTEGRLPESQDYAHALALVLGLNIARIPAEIRNRINESGEASGLPPEEFVKTIPERDLSEITKVLKPEEASKPSKLSREMFEDYPRKMQLAREERITEQKAKEIEREGKIKEPFKESLEKVSEKQKDILARRKEEIRSAEGSSEKKREALRGQENALVLREEKKLNEIAEREEGVNARFEERKSEAIEKMRRQSERDIETRSRAIQKEIDSLERVIAKEKAKAGNALEKMEQAIKRANEKGSATKRLMIARDAIQNGLNKKVEAFEKTIEKNRRRIDAFKDQELSQLEKRVDRELDRGIPASETAPLNKAFNALEREIAGKRKEIADAEARLSKEHSNKVEEFKKEAQRKLRALESKKSEMEKEQATSLKAQREKAYAARHPVREVKAKPSLPAVRVQAATEPLIETTGQGAAERIEHPKRGLEKLINKTDSFIEAAKTPKESLKRLGESTNEAIFNALAPLERLESEIPVPQRPSTRIRMAQSAASEINSVLENGVFSSMTGRFEHEGLKGAYGDLTWKKLSKGLKPNEYSLEDLDAYRVSKVALKRQSEGKKTGVDTKLAIQDVARLKSKYEPIDKKIREFQKVTLETYGKDLLGPDLIALWNREYYAPLYRIMEEGKDPILSAGSLKPKQPFKKMVGSERKVIPPSESDPYNSAMLIRNARKNDAILHYLKNVLEGNLPGKIKSAKNEPLPVAIALDELGIDPEFRALAEAIYGQTRTNAFTPEKNTLKGWKDGKPFTIEVPEEIYNVFSTLAPQEIGSLAKIFAATNRLFSRGISLEPRKFFSITGRDALSSLVYSRTGSNPISVAEALSDILGAKPVYKEFLAMGGDVYASRLAERIDRSKRIEDLITPGKEGILVTFEKIGDYFRKYSDTLGNISLAVPLAEYKRSLAKYGNTAEGRIMAAMEARLVTYDPMRKGSSKIVRELGNFVPFWNVSLQDLAMLGRNLKSPEAWVKGTVAITIPTLLLKMANEGNEEYEALTPVDKAAFWHVYFGDKHLRIPIPWLLGTTFKVGAETFYDSVMELAAKGDPRAKDAWTGLYENFVGNLSGDVPPLVQAYMEQTTGKSAPSPLGLLLGTESKAPEVVPRRLQDLPPELQYTAKTSQVARWFGDLWGVSPVKVDRIIKGFGTQVASDLLALTDEIAYFSGMAEDLRPAQKEANYLLLGNWVSNSPPSRTKYANEFYEYLREATQNKRAQKVILEKGITDAALDQVDFKGVDLFKYNRQLSKLFKAMRSIEDDREMLPSTKKRELDAYQRDINDLYKRAVEDVREAKKAPSV